LERLYRLGYRPVTLLEFTDGRMNLPPGASPVVMTFDDAHPNQFYFLKDGSIDPNSAVGIWREFERLHPDFPLKATWFVVPKMAFGQPKSFGRKIKLLREWGSEIAVHTMTHCNLGEKSDDRVKTEFGHCAKILKGYGVEAKTIAYPYGVPPKNRVLAKEFLWNGRRYKFSAAVLAGSGPAPSPNSGRYRPFAMPRIQAINGDYGIHYWLNRAKSGEVKVYVQP
jgi:peptidoglycan/xylan/chitin deacetylase (PgdA/CDA1 family)